MFAHFREQRKITKQIGYGQIKNVLSVHGSVKRNDGAKKSAILASIVGD